MSTAPSFIRTGILFFLINAAILTFTSNVWAASLTADQLLVAVNTAFVILCTALVFFMQIGFIMLEAGFTQVKNASNIAMKGITDFSFGVLIFFVAGFALMFGKDLNGVIGMTGFFLNGNLSNLELPIPVLVFFLFQAAFAGATATIVSGAIHGRMKFSAYVVTTALLLLIIYAVVGHWVWNSDGWLAKLGMQDFAGSAVVHTVGGFAALAAALVLGARIGKYGEKGEIRVIPGHNIPLAALGTFILWFGWFGFNGGSALSLGDVENLGLIVVNTNIAAAAGAFAAMFYTWFRYKKSDVTMTLNGALAGLVAITGGCAYVQPWAALLIGSFAGILCTLSVIFIDRLKIDDPIGAISVHGICGAFGILALGLFHSQKGLLLTGNPNFFLIQLLGEIVVIAWAFGVMWLLYKVVDKIFGLRPSPKEEEEGLDLREHGIESYTEFLVSEK